jgi:hypothetical protein
MVKMRNAYKVLFRKHEGKRLLGIPKRRWKDNIKVNFREIGCGCVDWIRLAQGRGQWRAPVNTAMNIHVP